MDWLAGILGLIAAYVIGCKKRSGFVIRIVEDTLWIYIAIRTGLYGLLIVCFLHLVLNIRNFYRWKRNGLSS